MIMGGSFRRSIDAIDVLCSTTLAFGKTSTASSLQSMAIGTSQSDSASLEIGLRLTCSRSLKGTIESKALAMTAHGAIAFAADFACSALSTGVCRPLGSFGRTHGRSPPGVGVGLGLIDTMDWRMDESPQELLRS
jgi:hypothetical protein